MSWPAPAGPDVSSPDGAHAASQKNAATGAALMREIAHKGPVVVGLSGRQLGDDFMMYLGGVYTGEEKPPDQPGGHAFGIPIDTAVVWT